MPMRSFQTCTRYLGITALFAAAFCFPEVAAAAASDAGDMFSTIGKTLIIGIGSIITIFATIFATLFAALIGQLMGSTFILDTGMGETLQLVWVVMRNLVNIAFGLFLVWLSGVVVLGIGGDQESGIVLVKKVVPKLMIALIAVNFTFFASRFVLSANDILATSVFALPQAVWHGDIRPLPCPATVEAAAGGKPSNADCLKEITDGLSNAAERKSPNGEPAESSFDAVGDFLEDAFSATDSFFASWIDRDNFALAMLTNMLDVKSIMHLNAERSTFFGTLVATLGGLVTTVVTAATFFMLLVALVVRMVMLWVLIALAPLGVMYIILEEFFPRIPGLDQISPVETFMKYAFMPLLVAFPLSIGMIMIFAGNALTSVSGVSSDSISSFLAGDFYSLLWWAAAIGVLWVGSRKAIEASGGIAANLTQSVYDGVNGFGKAAVQSLKYAPIFPIPAGDGLLDFNGLRMQPDLMLNKMRGRSQKNAEAFSGEGGDEAGADHPVDQLAALKSRSNHDAVLENAATARILHRNTSERAGKLRKKYLEAIGVKNAPEAAQLESANEFERFLKNQKSLNKELTGFSDGAKLHEKLGSAAKTNTKTDKAAKLSAAAEEILAKIRAAQTAEELEAAHKSFIDSELSEEENESIRKVYRDKQKEF